MMIYEKARRMTLFFLIVMMFAGSGCSRGKKCEEQIPLKFENIRKISCSVRLRYPVQVFELPEEVIPHIDNMLRTKISSVVPMKGAPFLSFEIACEDHIVSKVDFLVIDDGYILVQCKEKKFLGKMTASDFGKLFELLGKMNSSIADFISSAPEIRHKPYADLKLAKGTTAEDSGIF